MASPPVVVSKKFAQRLNKQIQACMSAEVAGFLLGYATNPGIHISGCYACKDASPEGLELGLIDVYYYLPYGLIPVGYFYKAEQATSSDAVQNALEKVITRQFALECFGDQLFIWPVEACDNSHPESLYWYNAASHSTTQVDIVMSDESPLKKLVTTRLHAHLPIGFEVGEKKAELEENVMAEFESLAYKVTCRTHDQVVYKIRGTNVILGNFKDPVSFGASLDTPVRTIIDMIETEDTDARKRRKAGDYSQEVIHMDMLVNLSGGSPPGYAVNCAPIIHHEHKDYNYMSLTLPVDIILMVDPEAALGGFLARNCDLIARQLSCMHRCLAHYRQGPNVHIPRPHHFLVPGVEHYLTVIYPDDIPDIQLELYRRELHDRFLLPDIPCLRKLNTFRFPDEGPADGYLKNTHVGLSHSGVKEGKVYLVSGTYSYHHYMQDRMDDNGWGCAYRSLQTLVSWFRHQGYTDKPIPTHRNIQQILVDLGDKEPKFIGSKQWIGSTEVSYVLDSYIGVTSKILFVSSGAELASKGRDLAMHFESQGTPVMIGGGVLAHTILGVDFNDVTGDLRFLILDPHYTGAEDLKTIQDKGWCGWKGPDFWDQNAYYNMCMPQRPTEI